MEIIAKQMNDLIEECLNGNLSVQEFDDKFSAIALSIPVGLLPDKVSRAYDSIRVKLEWTTANPDSQAKHYGYLSHDEFRSWLRVVYDSEDIVSYKNCCNGHED